MNLLLKLPSSLLSCVLVGRRILCSRKQVGLPSVGVGSLALGGAGKTTLALKVAEIVSERGLTPAIVHSGFGGTKEGVFFPKTEQIEGLSDEVVSVLRRNFICASIRRREKAAEMLKDVADVLVFDDFFSYLLETDAKVLIFTRESIGNMLVFPFGPLREPISSSAWADVALIEYGATNIFVKRIRKMVKDIYFFSTEIHSLLFSENENLSVVRPHEVRRARAILISAVALPERFSKMVRALGVDVVEHFALPDHSTVPGDLIYEVQKKIEERTAEIVMTTEKDFWKMVGRLRAPLYGARPEIRLEREDEFRRKIFCLLSV